jgi:hypothetical protein
MIPEKFRILMNNEIDGVNTPAERDELDLYLVRHPDARQYFEELRLSLEVLDEIGNVEPPEELHARVMAAVDRLAPVERKAATQRPSWQEFVFGRLRMGYAFSAAIGVMLGFLMHTLVPVDGMGRDLTALELFQGTTTTELMDGWQAAGPVDLASGGIEGQVHAYQQGDKVMVRFDLQSLSDVRLGFRFRDTVRLRGIHYIDNEGFGTAVNGRELEFSGAGACRCEFMVDAAEVPDLDLTLVSSGDQGESITRSITWR